MACAKLRLLPLLGVAALSIKLKEPEVPPTIYFWSGKNGDGLRTGSSASKVVTDISNGPTWSFKENTSSSGGLIRAAPLIDDQKNIYLSTVTSGTIYKFTADGKLLWKHKATNQLPGIPAIMDGRLFSATAGGEAFALNMETGEVLWTKKIAPRIAGDTWSMAASNGVVISPAAGKVGDNNRLVAMNPKDGEVLWTHTNPDTLYNILVSVKGDSCVFSDCVGGIRRLNLHNGSLVWAYPKPTHASFTTGGAAIGPDGNVYVTWNEHRKGKEGHVGAFTLESGRKLWDTSVGYEANNAPSVAYQGKAGLSVIVGVGSNPEPPIPLIIKSGKGPEHKARILALNAATGNVSWRYELEPWHGAALGDDHRSDICLPDAFGNVAIGGDGRVYVGFQSGKLYSVGGNDGNVEALTWQTGAAFQGSPGIAPGMLVATPCNGMHVWRS